jgi:hypothetical protein
MSAPLSNIEVARFSSTKLDIVQCSEAKPPRKNVGLLAGFCFSGDRSPAGDGLIATGLQPINQGATVECWWYEGNVVYANHDGVELASCDDYAMLSIQREFTDDADFAEISRDVYGSLFSAIQRTQHHHIAKIWNYFGGIDDFSLVFPAGSSYQLVIRSLQGEATVSVGGKGYLPGEIYTLCGQRPVELSLHGQAVETISQWEWAFNWSDTAPNYGRQVEKAPPVRLSITVTTGDMSCPRCNADEGLDACLVGNWTLDGDDLDRLVQPSGALCGIGSEPTTTGAINVIFDENGYFNALYQDIVATAAGRRDGYVSATLSGMATGCYGIRSGRYSLTSADPRLHVDRDTVDSFLVSTTTESCSGTGRSNTTQLKTQIHLITLTIPVAFKCSETKVDFGKAKYTRAAAWSSVPDERLVDRYLVVGLKVIGGRARGSRTRTSGSPKSLIEEEFIREATADAIEGANITLGHQVNAIRAGLKEMFPGARVIINVIPHEIISWVDWQETEELESEFTTVIAEDYLVHAVAPARVYLPGGD